MYCTWPGGVWLARVTVSVAAVFPLSLVSWRLLLTDRYWSSLFPPRLMTSETRESGVRSPDTPVERQTASVAGLVDHNMRWRPAVAAERASTMACSPSGWVSNECITAVASVPSSLMRAASDELVAY